jgi:2-polyprenyl-3-methyl-5-hydroxy-6-metoxy-1,4-benzoquinol methylase
VSSDPARYDAIADWYAEFSKDWDSQPIALLPGDLRGQRVLDLGCGYGVASRYLAQHGAIVTGLDVSAVMLSRARQAEAGEPLGSATSTATRPPPTGGTGWPTTACCATWR